jgi:hypothetical protein
VANLAGASSAASRSASRAAVSPVTTVAFNFSVAVSGITPSPVTVTVTGTGQADLGNRSVALAVNIPAVVARLIPGGSAAPQVVDVVESGGTVYAQVPGLASLVGRPWISVALPPKAKTAGVKLFTKVAAALGDVNALVQSATAHHATVTSLGQAIVDGVDATGNKVVTSLTRKGTSVAVTATVWADSSDRLVQADVALSGAGESATLGVTATVNFTGYGEGVDITVPPASLVKAVPLSTVEAFLGKGHHVAHHA